MDSTLQIKKDIISRINDSEDLGTLRTLKKLLDASDETVYILSEEQENAIEISRQQIKNGEVISHEILMSNMKIWLKNQ